MKRRSVRPKLAHACSRMLSSRPCVRSSTMCASSEVASISGKNSRTPVKKWTTNRFPEGLQAALTAPSDQLDHWVGAAFRHWAEYQPEEAFKAVATVTNPSVRAVAMQNIAIGWAAAMMYALRTWWIGAVGTTQLSLHVDAIALAAGAAGVTIASIGAVAWTVRAISGMTPRAQLTGATTELSRGRAHLAGWLALSAFVLAVALAI